VGTIKLSHKLNIQIFATTHSLDTLWAFQEIAKNDDAAVIKLQSLPKKNKIKAVNFRSFPRACVGMPSGRICPVF
jgi:hypothetical protein